ncbi:ABC-F family ATP-binding cassette domain-containing protein [Halalkalibacter hemicellulosilyticus]|uniref:ATPase components of ABC transporters with duplicated ATPase domains n=1 Tax=Halalkalibacter hemicellulosilyticusJCM 9152 TaxID=1236971 RepID=W4QHG3_9BACI|nr:ABC-F family ATP-binding cassette domain-containing protein [Halalkalibacter hemicellulosilyticus]GAE31093.1 ATPase components of ABC transporters with duplicated ATPase domains [Halalkalibacter hemicellulosilyticusJCM 9152]
MSILQVDRLTKSYGEKVLFQNISFTIEEQQRIGLIGVNGTGKSSLMKIIAGVEGADTGELHHANDFQIEYLSQHSDLDDGLTVLEEIYAGDSNIMVTMRAYEESLSRFEREPANEAYQKTYMKWQQKMDELEAWEANTMAKTILTKLGVRDFHLTIGQLSGGQKKRVAIAKALIQPADLLLLDEPTNHLDHASIEWLEGYLANYKGAIVLITHDRYFLNRVTNYMFELDQGALFVYEGNYERFLEKKAERQMQAEHKEQKRQNLLRRELAWLKRGAKARTTKQKARIQRIDQIKEDGHESIQREFDFAIGSRRLGKQVIELKAVSKQFANQQIVDSLNELIIPGERIGIVGANGTGKTTLLNILAGRSKPDSGEVLIGETVHIGYYTQEDKEINGDLRVIDYIKEIAEVVYTADGTQISAEQMLERFLFPRSSQYTYIRRLSGGERRRLYLLRVLMEEPNVLFLDEPTNDLDTETLSVLEDYLEQFPGVVITVSHDRYFLDRIVDRLLVFEGNGKVSRFQGHYSDYLEVQKEVEEQRKRVSYPEPKKKEKPKARKKLSYREQLEWDQIEERITMLEQQVEEIEKAIENAGSDFGQIQPLLNEKEQVEMELEAAIERWTELSLLIEELQQ